MKIFLTGSNGFIANDIINQLQPFHDMTGIGRQAVPKQDIAYFQCDLTDRDRLLDIAAGQKTDAVIHCAAAINGSAENLYLTNCFGTQNMVDFAIHAGCKYFIYISSMPIIGTPREVPLTENHPADPPTVYHMTKYFGEQIVAKLADAGINYKIYRIASPVGRSMPKDKIFSVFVENARSGKDIHIWGNGKRVQNYLDTRDLANAVNQGIASECSGLYLINGNSLSDYDLALECKKYFTSNCKIIRQDMSDHSDPGQWIINGEKAMQELGYSPERSIKDSIRYVVEGL